MSATSDRVVRLGQIAGVHGVKGWVKVVSFTEPRTNLFEYDRWLLELGGENRDVAVEAGQESGKRLIAKLSGIDDRDAAAELIGADIGVRRSDMPACAPGEYYWADLEGLEVRNREGELLGRVDRLLSTGANDVLVLDGDGNRLIPFVEGETILRVNLDAGEIVADWHESYWD